MPSISRIEATFLKSAANGRDFGDPCGSTYWLQPCRCMDRWRRVAPWLFLLLAGLIFAGLVGNGRLQAGEQQPREEIVWHDDYTTAYTKALEQGKMLLVVFRAPRPTVVDRHFRSKVLADPSLAARLGEYVCAELPTDAKVRVDGREQLLIGDPSLAALERCRGLAVIDLAHKGQPFYQCVVNALPFDRECCYSIAQMEVVLDLSPGTLEERTAEYTRRMRSLVAGEERESLANLPWKTDYAKAHRAAEVQGKMLLVFFCDASPDSLGKRYERDVLCSPPVRGKLGDFVLARLPLDAQFQSDGRKMRVLDHAGFAEMLGGEGIAMVDLANEKCDGFGCVVSTFPFLNHRPFTVEQTLVMLDLPPGTLTQRTLIYAVRTHPERPASTNGKLDSNLVSEAGSHSNHQARIRLQGHHNWNTRFHRINRLLPRGLMAREVCAESWPGQRLLEAAIECVRCWRYSSGHWSAVRANKPCYGYDMRRGSNGVWYATGIFGDNGG